MLGYRGWAEGHDAVRLEAPYDLRAWEVLTEASGTLRFEVSVPTVAQTWLTVRPDTLHADAYLSRFEEPVVVERRQVTRGPDFLLAQAPTLGGRVRDEGRRPIAGGRRWSWPESHGSGAAGRSEE